METQQHPAEEFKCTVCNKTYKRQPYLTRHVNSVHRELAEKILPSCYYLCQICGISVKNKKDMAVHAKRTGHFIKQQERMVTVSELQNPTLVKLLKIPPKLPNKGQKGIPRTKKNVSGKSPTNLLQSSLKLKSVTDGERVIVHEIEVDRIPLPNVACLRCPFRSDSDSVMSIHASCHDIVSSNRCRFCDYSTTSSHMLLGHVGLHFVSDNDPAYQKISLSCVTIPLGVKDAFACMFCGVQFSTIVELHSHQDLHK